MRITLDIPDDAYAVARAIAREQGRSVGCVISDLILRSVQGAEIRMSDYGFPTFRCMRMVTSEDVKDLD